MSAGIWARWRVTLVTVIVAVAIAFTAPGVSAQEGSEEPEQQPAADGPLTIEEVEAGECSPAVTLPGRVVDCRFPLSGAGWNVEQFDLPVVAELDVSFDDDDPATCRVEELELVCTGVEAFFRIGRSEVSVRLGFGESRALASFEIVDPSDYSIDAFVVGASEPVAAPGRPVILGVYPTGAEEGVTAWAEVRRRGESDILDVVPIATAGPDETWPDTAIEAPSDAGRYTITLCVGSSPQECEALPGQFGFQVLDTELRELVAGHNIAEADRINVVFAGTGFTSVDQLVEIATGLLALEGPTPLDFGGRPIDGDIADIDPGDVLDLAWGPFAIEPLKSQVAKFNFWYLEGNVVDARALFHDAHPDFSRDDELAGFDLGHVSVVAVDLQTDGQYGRSEANWTSFRLREDVPRFDEIEFAGIYLAVDGFWPYGASETLAHEFGHALFDLRDEYSEGSRTVQFGYPNCASGIEQADAWWGDRVGDTDPFVHTYIEMQQRFGLWVPEDLIEQTTVGFSLGGCYSGGDEVVRPTGDSLMSSEVPIFGPVNRTRVEDILGQFSGRAQLSEHQDLRLRCLPGRVAVPGRLVRCSGELTPGFDAPSGELSVAVAGRGADCMVGEVDEAGVRSVECEQVELFGSGPWTVSVSIDSGLARFVTRIDNGLAVESAPADGDDTPADPPDEIVDEEPVVSSTSTSATTEATSAVTGDGTTSLPWSIAAAAFAIVFIGAGGYFWSRPRTKPGVTESDEPAD